MAFRMTLWALALLFIATIYNVGAAYYAMGGISVQDKFEEIGLLDDGTKGEFPLPVKKPLHTAALAMN